MQSTESTLGTAPLAAPTNSSRSEYTKDERSIISEIQQKFPDARDWRFDKIGSEFIDGNTYTVWFTTQYIPNKRDSWLYAYVDKSGCRLFNDGDQTVVFMQRILEQRRSLLQRLRDFDFLDIIGAMIALPVTLGFVYITITAKDPQSAISKEFLTIVSLILGYYFGRNKQK